MVILLLKPIFLYTQSHPSIDLTLPLKQFQHCNVEIIDNILIENPRKLDLVPLVIPATINWYFYRQEKGGVINCDNQRFDLKDITNRTNFLKAPQMKKNCTVYLYFTPMTCSLWDVDINIFRRYDFTQTPQVLVEATRKIFPFHMNMLQSSNVYFVLLETYYHTLTRNHRFNLLLAYEARLFHEFAYYISPTFVVWPIYWNALSLWDMQFVCQDKVFLIEKLNLELYQLAQRHCLRNYMISSTIDWVKDIMKRRFLLPTSGIYDKVHDCLTTIESKAIPTRMQKVLPKNVTSLLSSPSVTRASAAVVFFPSSSMQSPDSYDLQKEGWFANLLLENVTILPPIALELWPSYFSLVSFSLTTFPQNVYATLPSNRNIYFVSCAVPKQLRNFSLTVFLSSFDLSTWIALVGLALTSTVLICLIKDEGNPELKKSAAFTWEKAIFVYKLLLLQESKPLNTSKWLTLPWLLLGVVFSYGYQGENVKELTKPIQSYPLLRFSEIINANFTIYQPNVQGALIDQVLTSFFSNYSFFLEFGLFAKNHEQEFLLHQYFEGLRRAFGWDVFSRSIREYIRPDKVMKLIKLLKLPKTYSELHKMASQEYFINSLSKCNKVAYIDGIANVSKIYVELLKAGKVNRKHLQISIESLDRLYTTAKFQNFPKNLAAYIWRRMGSMFQAGISQTLNIYNAANATLKYGQVSNFQRVSLNGNIALSFYLILVLAAVACISYIVECRLYLVEFLSRILRNPCSKFLNVLMLSLHLNSTEVSCSQKRFVNRINVISH